MLCEIWIVRIDAISACVVSEGKDRRISSISSGMLNKRDEAFMANDVYGIVESLVVQVLEIRNVTVSTELERKVVSGFDGIDLYNTLR